jgi:uncharacterized protein (TIGR03546 family)
MFLFRKIGAALRGKATPPQIFMAALLAGLLGFVPGFFLPGDLGGGFAQAPGLILCLLFVTLILNANLAVFGVVLLAAKLVSLMLVSVSFELGRLLLDGPLQGLFKALVNAPVSAWFGLEYYATTGGLVLGAIFGTLAGLMLVRTVRAIRTKMATVEATSEAYQKWSRKRSVRFLSWAFLGKGKGKKTWQELAESEKRGLPIRITGVVLVLVLGASLWVFQQWFSSPILTAATRDGLTAVNGATVDLEQARIDLAAGELKILNLAIADANDLATDLFRAGALEARIDTTELLRKRLVIDQLRAADASSGLGRTTPGTRTPRPEPPPPPPPEPGTKSIEDWVKEAQVWKDRLAQLQDWLEKLKGPGDDPTVPREVRERELEEERARVGAARVKAEHLIEDAPTLLIRSIDIEGISVAMLPGETLDLRGKNLATQPSLVAAAASLGVGTRSDKLKLQLAGGANAKGPLGLDFAFRRLPVDSLFGRLKLAGQPPVQGGTMDLVSNGAFDFAAGAGAMITLPLQVTMTGSTFAFPGMQPAKVDSLVLPVGVRGALTSPRIALDDKSLADALLKAGKQELASFVQGQAGKLLGGVPGAAQIVDPTKSVAENIEAAKKAAEEAAKKAAEDAAKRAAEDAAKKGLGDTLKGLFPGGKKEEPKKEEPKKQ